MSEPFMLTYNGLRYWPDPKRVDEMIDQGALACAPSREAVERGDYDLVVLCARDATMPTLPKGAVGVHLKLDDTKEVPMPVEQVREVLDVSRAVHVARVLDRRVLVACAMGLNRSGLVTALALRRAGYDPKSAVEKVRAARGPDALSNARFERMVWTLPIR